MSLVAAGASRKGEKRKQNEDAWRIYLDQPHVERAGRGSLFVVSDGVGGTGSGKAASWMVVDSLLFYFTAPADPFEPGPLLQQVLKRTTENLCQLAATDKAYTMAGATLALIGVLPGERRGYWLSIGDSPIYLERQGIFHRLNPDHRDARGKVTSYVGMPGHVQVATRPMRIDPGDRFLLCSDGVREMLPEATIRTVLCDGDDIQAIADTIVLLAESAGGDDNATAVVLHVTP